MVIEVAVCQAGFFLRHDGHGAICQISWDFAPRLGDRERVEARLSARTFTRNGYAKGTGQTGAHLHVLHCERDWGRPAAADPESERISRRSW